MRIKEELTQWLANRQQPQTIICDIDETLCTQFDHPIAEAIACLKRLPSGCSVHYVTARPPSSLDATEAFLVRHGLPTPEHIFCCPLWQRSASFKTSTILKITESHEVLMSIGDADEDEQASLAAGVFFIRVDPMHPALAWAEAEAHLFPT